MDDSGLLLIWHTDGAIISSLANQALIPYLGGCPNLWGGCCWDGGPALFLGPLPRMGSWGGPPGTAGCERCLLRVGSTPGGALPGGPPWVWLVCLLGPPGGPDWPEMVLLGFPPLKKAIQITSKCKSTGFKLYWMYYWEYYACLQ